MGSDVRGGLQAGGWGGAAGIARGIDDEHLSDLPEHTALDELVCLQERRAASLLQPHLHHPVILPGRLHHLEALGDAVGQRLLHVNVLARLARRDGDRTVPVVRRGHHDYVNILALQNAPVVAVSVRLRSGGRRALFEVRFENVTNRRDTDTLHRLEVGQQGSQAAAPAADQGNRNLTGSGARRQ